MPSVPPGLNLRDSQNCNISHSEFLSAICHFVSCIYEFYALYLGRGYQYCRFLLVILFSLLTAVVRVDMEEFSLSRG